MTELPTIRDVRAAAQRVAPFVHRTPIVTSTFVDRAVAAEVFFKAENLQKVGAFKARGALNAVLSLPETVAERGVLTHSSGNHGQALAYAAAVRGVPCTVVMPDDAPDVKVAAVRGYGATVEFCPHMEREATTEQIRAATGAALVHPFDDPAVIAGQGTAALELFADIGHLDDVVAPIGGGGLLSGTAIVAADAYGKDVSIIGAEPLAADDAYRSLVSGERQPAVPDPVTVADGLRTGIGELPFVLLTDLGAEIITATEPEIRNAARVHFERMKLVVEPSGAVPLAVLLNRTERFAGRRVGVIVSGGNTDFGWW